MCLPCNYTCCNKRDGFGGCGCMFCPNPRCENGETVRFPVQEPMNADAARSRSTLALKRVSVVSLVNEATRGVCVQSHRKEQDAG